MTIENINELDNVQKYICGSPNLCKFIEQNGIQPIYSYQLGKERNNRTMWVFLMTEDLSKLLTQWTNNKPKNKIK